MSYRERYFREERVLLGPGPSLTPPSVRSAMARPPLGHMDPALMPVLEATTASLRQVFQTAHEVTFPVSGTGTAGMEAALANALEPGDRIVVAASGYFALRIAEIAARIGADVTVVEAPWGQAVDAADVERAVAARRTKVVAAAHVETSTGVVQPLLDLARIAHASGADFLVDAVASLGGIELPVDAWGIDLCYSGSQKCLSAPPGLAPLTIAGPVLERPRTHPVQSFYLDAKLLWQYWASPHTYHHTVPVPLVFALHEALRLVLAEGLAARCARHTANARALEAGLTAMGLELFAPASLRSSTVVTVELPSGVDDARVRGRLLDEHGIEIAGGLGPLRGRIWRIGLMGYSSQGRLVVLLLHALEAILRSEGVALDPGAGPASAAHVLDTTGSP